MAISMQKLIIYGVGFQAVTSLKHISAWRKVATS